MGQVWEWIIGGIARFVLALKNAAAGIVGKVLGTFGLTLVSFETLLPSLKGFVMQFVSGLPAEIMQFLGAIGIGIAMSMILSALTVRMAWKVFLVPTAVANSIGGGGS